MFSHLDSKVPYPVDLDSGLKHALETRNYALVSETENIYRLVGEIWQDEDKICRTFKQIPLPDYKVLYSGFVRKDSPFITHFNYAYVLNTL